MDNFSHQQNWTNFTDGSAPAWQMAPTHIFVISSVISALGLIVNVPHIIILSINPPGKYQGSINNRTLLISTAVLDIIASVIKLPLDSHAAQYFLEKNTWACAITATAYGLGLCTEVFLMIGCIDRFTVIKLGGRYATSVLGRHFGKFLLIPVFYYITLLGLIDGLYYDFILRPRGFTICYYMVPKSKLVLLTFMLGIITPVLVTFSIYIALVVTIKRNDKKRQHGNTMFSYRVATYIVIATAGQLICWAPPFLNMILHASGNFSWHVYYMGPLLVAVNSFIRPFIYGLMSKQYRRHASRTLLRCRRTTLFSIAHSSSVSTSQTSQT